MSALVRRYSGGGFGRTRARRFVQTFVGRPTSASWTLAVSVSLDSDDPTPEQSLLLSLFDLPWSDLATPPIEFRSAVDAVLATDV